MEIENSHCKLNTLKQKSQRDFNIEDKGFLVTENEKFLFIETKLRKSLIFLIFLYFSSGQ